LERKILERMELLVDRMRVYSEQVRLDLRMAMHVRRQVVELLSIWTDESDKNQRIIAFERFKNRTEKEVGPWFWRRDRSKTLEIDLACRAKQLREMGYSVQWQWDLLVELMTDWEGESDTVLLERIVREAHSGDSAG